MSTIIERLPQYIKLSEINLSQYVEQMFESLSRSSEPSDPLQNRFMTQYMQWFLQLQSLVHLIGWMEDSKMRPETWKYAISESLRLAHIELVPGFYHNRPSYANLIRLHFDDVKQKAIQRCIQTTLPNDCLGFILPIVEFPPAFSQALEKYLQHTPPKRTHNIEDLIRCRKFVKRITSAIDISCPYDQLL